jgi:phytoene dehydrogenase-like protein
MGYPDMSALILAAAFVSFSGDYWTIKNGMQSWADVLAENFKQRGGELKLNSRIDAIVTENGTAIGVKSKGEIFKSDYVISASDFKKTFFKLLDDRSALKQDFISRTEKAAVSEAFFTVYLGLDMPVETLRARMKIPHMHYYDYSPDYDIGNRNDKAFFEKTSPSLYSPSLINSNLAPDGKSSLMIQCMCPHRWMDNWGNGDKKVYKELKHNAMQSLINKTGKIIPDLKKHTIFMDAATPLTYERFTGNTGGASSAWSWNPKKKYYKTPIGVTVTTPVKNLLLSSCWAAQIGGVPSAVNAAYKCVELVG